MPAASCANRVTQSKAEGKAMKWEGVGYEGNAVSFTERLVGAAHGGQVVLSGSAWASVQDGLPGLSQVGCHLFPTLLFSTCSIGVCMSGSILCRSVRYAQPK